MTVATRLMPASPMTAICSRRGARRCPTNSPDEAAKRVALIEADREEPFSYGVRVTPHDTVQRKWGMAARSPFETL